MLQVKYAVIALRHKEYLLHRFEDTKLEIRAGKLPRKFSKSLYGPKGWYVFEIFPARTSEILEGVRSLAGPERAQELAREIFEAGKRAGRQEGISLCSASPTRRKQTTPH